MAGMTVCPRCGRGVGTMGANDAPRPHKREAKDGTLVWCRPTGVKLPAPDRESRAHLKVLASTIDPMRDATQYAFLAWLTSAEGRAQVTAMRDSLLVEALDGGAVWRTVASRYGVSEVTVNEAVTRHNRRVRQAMK